MGDNAPFHAPLAQCATRDGRTVKVEIFQRDKSGWILEVVDEYGNAAVWNEPFDSDRQVLDEVIDTIDKEGIGALIGAPSPEPAQTMRRPGISQADLIELKDFLGYFACPSASMDIVALHGCLTAFQICRGTGESEITC